MQIYLYNTLTRNKELFKAQDQTNIKIYVCGPTVYDSPHIGNSKSVVVYNLLYHMVIKIFGEKAVTYVRNITDVDDSSITGTVRSQEVELDDCLPSTCTVGWPVLKTTAEEVVQKNIWGLS